ncbi:MAG: serine--tRNA ligase, partial [Candidatus Aenigmatarchaeota archaeon]
KQKISKLEDEVDELKEERDELRYRIGNILHESVPQGEDEDDNVEIKTWEPENGKQEDSLLAADIIEENDLVETDKAADLAGERAYYL